MDISNILTGLQAMAAKNASGISTRGTSAQRLSLLAGGGAAIGATVIDSVTGQAVEVVSVGVAYLPKAVLDEVQ